MITVRIEYGGMRAERTAADTTSAQAQLTDMYAHHSDQAGPHARDRERYRRAGTRNIHPVLRLENQP